MHLNNNMTNQNTQYKILSPRQFSGNNWGDWGYEINGVKSDNSYVSETGARNALDRKLDKLEI